MEGNKDKKSVQGCRCKYLSLLEKIEKECQWLGEEKNKKRERGRDAHFFII